MVRVFEMVVLTSTKSSLALGVTGVRGVVLGTFEHTGSNSFFKILHFSWSTNSLDEFLRFTAL